MFSFLNSGQPKTYLLYLNVLYLVLFCIIHCQIWLLMTSLFEINMEGNKTCFWTSAIIQCDSVQ